MNDIIGYTPFMCSLFNVCVEYGSNFLVNGRGMNIEELVTGPIITCHTDR